MKGLQMPKSPELKIQPGNAVRPYHRQQYSRRKQFSFAFDLSYTEGVIYNKAV
jgi:hypothetical protein